MNYKIEQKAAFSIVAYTKEMIKIDNDEDFYEIAYFWSNLTDVKINQLITISDGTLQGLLGVSDSNKSPEKQFNYMIGISVNHKETTTNSLNESQIPASNWAIIECIGAISAGVKGMDKNQPFEPNVMMQLKQRTDCLEAEGTIVENTKIPRIEFYPFGDMEAENYRCELWIPIK